MFRKIYAIFSCKKISHKSKVGSWTDQNCIQNSLIVSKHRDKKTWGNYHCWISLYLHAVKAVSVAQCRMGQIHSLAQLFLLKQHISYELTKECFKVLSMYVISDWKRFFKHISASSLMMCLILDCNNETLWLFKCHSKSTDLVHFGTIFV